LRFKICLATVILAATAAGFAGVNISAPTNGAVTNSPLHVAASANSENSSAQIAAIQIYVDGGLAYNAPGSTVDTHINLGAGNHEIIVQAWDTAGGNYKAPVYVAGSGSGVFLNSPGANATVTAARTFKPRRFHQTRSPPCRFTTMAIW
jgi:hypothetical protein